MGTAVGFAIVAVFVACGVGRVEAFDGTTFGVFAGVAGFAWAETAGAEEPVPADAEAAAPPCATGVAVDAGTARPAVSRPITVTAAITSTRALTRRTPVRRVRRGSG
jgi:hypothetical protein